MHPRYRSAFANLDAILQQELLPLIDSSQFKAILDPQTISRLMARSGLDENALALALLPLAASCALTPLSEFNVGAIARGISGHWYFGANMEFSGAPLQQTIHAEQCAVTHAWLSGEKQLVAITVNYTPCGHCRQFMNELNSGGLLQVCLPGRPPRTLAEYLPEAFGPADLQISQVLMDEDTQSFVGHQDPLINAAIQAAAASYAPYSGAYSGVALLSDKGTVYAGRYAENAAYNPSLPPLQSALILMNLQGGDCHAISQAVLAETAGAKLSQHKATRATLEDLGCHQLQVIALQTAP